MTMFKGLDLALLSVDELKSLRVFVDALLAHHDRHDVLRARHQALKTQEGFAAFRTVRRELPALGLADVKRYWDAL